MCGILGLVSQKSDKRGSALEHALTSLAHRGPDAQGKYEDQDCALGHVRLSIVDIKLGIQPMYSPDQNVVLVFNGEIYGYEKIKKELLDYPFKTNSDTEVILALYEKYGVDFVEHLPGMFAFALWDKRTETLVCGRDRFGEKPFYFAQTKENDFIFASEIKALLAMEMIAPEIDKASLVHYLTYLYVHPHTTIYKNIHVLPPAHYLVLKDGNIEIKRYWNLPKTDSKIGLNSATSEFQTRLETSIKNQLIADVPVGAFLSGGLDSSTIVAIASKYKKNLKTFSFEFEDAKSELSYAREVAERYKTDHTELKDSHYDIAKIIVEMSRVYDEPFADSSNIPTYIMSRTAREHAKVILTGDGGDELFGGYTGWYRPLLEMNRNKHSFKSRALSLFIKSLKKINSPYVYKLRDVERGLELNGKFSSILDAHQSAQRYFSEKEIESFDLSPTVPKREFLSFTEDSTVEDAIRMDIEDYMPGDILTKIDRASMAHGLELRSPFLDVDFAELCISLPPKYKISAVKDKIILRKAFSSLWPKSIKKRSKQGFGAPITKWLKLPTVQLLKKKYLEDSTAKIFTFIPFQASRSIVTRDDYQTWILLVLAVWLDTHNYPIV